MITGIGSLPHVDPIEAALFVLDTADVPYLPQLPNRHPSERMLAQWGDGLCSCGTSNTELGLGYGTPPGDRASAMVGSRTLLKMLPPDTERVKTQATGPVTLATAMMAAGHPAGDTLFECLIDGLVDRITEHLDSIRDRLPHTEVLILLDEPALSGAIDRSFPIGEDAARDLLRQVMDALPIRPGIHCCGPANWAMVASLEPAWISWDIDALGPQYERDREELAAAIAGGTRIMWGVVPVVMGSPPRDLVSRLQRAIGTLVVGGADMATLDDGALFTPACGLAGLTEGQAEIVARTVRSVVGDLSELWTP